MLDLIFVAVVGFGFLTAWFNAKTHIGQMAAVAVLVICVALAGLVYRQREEALASFAMAPVAGMPDPAAGEIQALSDRLSAKCRTDPDYYMCVPPAEAADAFQRYVAKQRSLAGL